MRTHIGQIVLDMVGALMDAQDDKGFSKYGETLDDVHYDSYDWQIMAMEEMVDGMKYLMMENQKLKVLLKEQENRMMFKDFQEMSKRTIPLVTVDNPEDMIKSNYALGLNGEAGELGDLIKKNVHHGHAFDRDKTVKEVGDVLHYLAGLCTLYGITLEEAATMNLVKLQHRYPTGFNKEDSIKRIDVRV